MKGAKILMFEDDPGYAELYRDAFIAVGMKVSWYPFPPETLIELAVKEAPSLISLDITMPGMDGLAAARLLKGNDKTKHIPIAFLTSMALTEYKNEAERLGAVAYCVKNELSPGAVAQLYNTLCSPR